MSQRFYAVPYDESSLIELIKSAGFKKDKSFPKAYSTEDAFLHVQRIIGGETERHIARDSGWEIGFVLELSEQRRYSENHPSNILLRSLELKKEYDMSTVRIQSQGRQ